MNFFHQNDGNNPACTEGIILDHKRLQETLDNDKELEALLFAAREPMTIDHLRKSCPNISDLVGSLERLRDFYQDRGVNLVRIKNSYAFRTAPKYGYLLKEYVEKKVKLSKAARETLTIIAYHQPVTRSEIETVRGVTLYKGLLDTLLETGWISLGSRREAPGRPVTFVTTNAFLDYFGLQTVKDMPNFQELNEAGLAGQSPSSFLDFE